jgi:acetyltransferase-like isoleucine patch superfamily enzyme
MALDESLITGQWPYSRLPNNVKLGSDCWLERYESFAKFRSEQEIGLSIGDRVRVYTWTSFNIEPTGCVEIGDGSILVGAVFMCAERITVGRRVTISYQVTLADSDFHPIEPDLRRQDAIANSPCGDKSQRPPYESRAIEIGDDVWIGIGAIILKGVRIGNGARVQAGAVVTSDIAAGVTVAGNPASPIDAVM